MSDIGAQALTKLFKLGDKIEVGNRLVSLGFNSKRFPPYHNIKNIDEKEALHAALENAARFGAIRIDWVRAYEGTEVERICLLDIAKLGEFIGKRTLAYRIDHALSCINFETLESTWLKDIFESVHQGWKDNKKPFGLAPEDVLLMCELSSLVNYLERDKNELDMRTVSARLFNDTKLIETKLLGKLVAIYRLHLNKDGASTEEILSDISLEKYPWPVFISAEINIISKENKAVYCGVKPFAGIPPDAITDFEVVGDIKYVLSIENFSSFNTYTRKIHDGGIIIYTNGFPNKWLAEFYKKLVGKVGGDVPLYHWGDVDVGGFRILAKMQEYAGLFGHTVNPHLMAPVSSYAKGFSKTEITDFMKFDKINSLADSLIQDIFTSKTGKVEQEYLTPCSPYKE